MSYLDNGMIILRLKKTLGIVWTILYIVFNFEPFCFSLSVKKNVHQENILEKYTITENTYFSISSSFNICYVLTGYVNNLRIAILEWISKQYSRNMRASIGLKQESLVCCGGCKCILRLTPARSSSRSLTPS